MPNTAVTVSPTAAMTVPTELRDGALGGAAERGDRAAAAAARSSAGAALSAVTGRSSTAVGLGRGDLGAGCGSRQGRRRDGGMQRSVAGSGCAPSSAESRSRQRPYWRSAAARWPLTA